MIRCAMVISLGLVALPARLFGGDSWPQFRGPSGQGISSARHVPVEWSASKNVAWKVEIPGKGWSSPVLSNGKVYLTCAEGGDGRPVTLHALCIDEVEGKTDWNVEVFQPDAELARAMHPKNSPASATPIVTEDRLFVHFGAMGTAALDLTGKIIWKQNSLRYAPVHGNGGSPVLAGDTLIFNCDGGQDPFVACLDARTGAVSWKTPRDIPVGRTFSFATPLLIEVDRVSELISPGSGMVAGYNPGTGRELWRVRYGEGYSVVPRPVYGDGLLFISSGFDNAVTYAIDPRGAAGDVTESHVIWKSKKAAPLTPSMLVSGEDLFFISDGGIATCADARTGKAHWTDRLDGNFSASPVLAEGRLYLLSEEGTCYVVEASESFKLLAVNDLQERSLASPAPRDGAWFIRTEKHLWKISAGPRG